MISVEMTLNDLPTSAGNRLALGAGRRGRKQGMQCFILSSPPSMRPANANQKLISKLIRSSESIVPPHPIKSTGFRPILSGGTRSVLGCKPLNKYAARYYRLKIRHGAIDAFLARIGIIETPKYWVCGAQEHISIWNAEDGEKSKGNYPENLIHKALACKAGPKRDGQVVYWQTSG